MSAPLRVRRDGSILIVESGIFADRISMHEPDLTRMLTRQEAHQ